MFDAYAAPYAARYVVLMMFDIAWLHLVWQGALTYVLFTLRDAAMPPCHTPMPLMPLLLF